MAQKDLTEKTLEAYNDVFSDIINVLVFHGKPIVKEDELEDASPLSMFKADGKLHEQERDVSKYWKKTNLRISLFGLENQTKYESVMPLRMFGYDGAAYRAQVKKDAGKDRVLYPVISLVLYFGNDHWTKNRSLREAISFPEGLEEALEPFFNDYRINLFEIAYLSDEQLSMFKSDFRIVAEYFVKSRTNPDYQPTEQTIQHVDAVLKLLSAMTGDNRFETVLNETKGGTVKTMSNVLDYREARGKILGMIEAYKDLGLSNAEIIQRLIDKFGLSQSEAEAYVLLPA